MKNSDEAFSIDGQSVAKNLGVSLDLQGACACRVAMIKIFDVKLHYFCFLKGPIKNPTHKRGQHICTEATKFGGGPVSSGHHIQTFTSSPCNSEGRGWINVNINGM